MVSNFGTVRWDPYVLWKGDAVRTAWQERVQAGARVLLVLGRGFDPRASTGLDALVAAGIAGSIHCLLICYDEGSTSPSHRHDDLVRANEAVLEGLLESCASSDRLLLEIGTRDAEVKARRALFKGVCSALGATGPTDLVIDISALPLKMYVPLLGDLLEAADAGRLVVGNLHCLAAEDVVCDRGIEQQGVEEEADYLPPTGGQMRRVGAGGQNVWLPILGEGRLDQVRRIHALVGPDELCPVLPWPSRDPRRGDGLLTEFRQLLIDEFQADLHNVLYVPEDNPFACYRRLRQAIDSYHEALRPLGGCRAVVSATSSKLLSIGALLVCHDAKQRHGAPVGFAHVGAKGYRISGEAQVSDATLYSMWLTGDCYAE